MADEITITVADAALPENWEKKALRALYAARVVAKPDVLLYKVSEGKPGDNINFTELGALSVAAPSAAGVIANTALTHTQRQIALSSWRSTAISVPTRAMYQSVLEYGQEFSVGAGDALGQDMDDLILDDHGSLTSNNEGSTTTPIPMSDALVRAAILDLDVLSVPKEKRTFILHPTAKWALLGDSDFKRSDATGKSEGGMVSGILHPLYGVKFVETPRVVQSGSVRKNLLLQEKCIGFVVQKDISITKHDRVGDLTVRWIAEYLCGEAVLRQNHGVVINTVA